MSHILNTGNGLRDNLVLSLSLDNNTNDNLNVNNGIATNLNYVSGIVGQAIDNGGIGNLRVPYSSTYQISSIITVSIWVKLNSYGSNTYFLSKLNNNNDNSYSIINGYFFSTGVCFYMAGMSAGQIATTDMGVLPLNTWTHIAYSYDGSTIKGYKDGVLTITSNISVPFSTDTHDLYLFTFDGNSNYSDCVIDEVNIWKKILAEYEVKRLYNRGKPLVFRNFSLPRVLSSNGKLLRNST